MINCLAHLIYKAPKFAYITPLLYHLHWLPISSWIQFQIALEAASVVSLVNFLHQSIPSCIIFALLLSLTLFAEPWILRSSMFQGSAGEPLGRDLFNT